MSNNNDQIWQLLPEKCSQRREKLLDACLESNVEFALLSDRQSVYYVSGYLRPDLGVLKQHHEFVLLGSSIEPVLFVGQSRYAQAQSVWDGEIICWEDYNIKTTILPNISEVGTVIRKHLKSLKDQLKSVGIEAGGLPAGVYDVLKELCPSCKFVDITTILERLRITKDTDEIELLRKGAEVCAKAYSVARKVIMPGMTETDLFAEIERELTKTLKQPAHLAGDVVSGERVLGIGGFPTSKPVRAGDMVILDLWFTVGGYWSDSARTLIVGSEPNKGQVRLHDAVCSALKIIGEILKPGITGKAAYDIVHHVLDQVSGMGDYFPHHAGHGIGLCAQESPFLIPAWDRPLPEGAVLTVEPGLYVPDIGGVRCENTYLIGTKGAELLTNISLDLVV